MIIPLSPWLVRGFHYCQSDSERANHIPPALYIALYITIDILFILFFYFILLVNISHYRIFFGLIYIYFFICKMYLLGHFSGSQCYLKYMYIYTPYLSTPQRKQKQGKLKILRNQHDNGVQIYYTYYL